MPERFLTYGSACQDCGFNNQRRSLEAAASLALASGRTLVVRNFVCSPHSPCPESSASADGVIPALGGVTAWRNTCALDGVVVCDQSRFRKDDGSLWGNGTRFLAARLVVDPAYFERLQLRYVWQDDFHAQHPELLHNCRATGRPCWVMVQRRSPLTSVECDATVWHAYHLHKERFIRGFAANAPLPSAWPRTRGPMVYGRPLQQVAEQVMVALQGLRSGHKYACAHIRLGDWGPWHGLEKTGFQPGRYAKALKQRLHEARHAPLYVATSNPQSILALRDHFELHTSASLGIEQRIRLAAGVFSNDLLACVEQLVCAGAVFFIGSPGSSVTSHIQAMRRSRRSVARGHELLLSPLDFFNSTYNRSLLLHTRGITGAESSLFRESKRVS